MQFHPLANIFPLIEGDAFAELVADVRANGVREAVWLHEGKILDGRNRWRAAQEAGVECPTRDFDEGDPVAFVVSLNLRRRHLDESQRGMVFARLATLPRGANQHTAIAVPTQAQAAELLNVSIDTGQRGRRILDHGAPELVAAVERGEVSVSAASRVASLPKEDQARAVAAGKEHMQRLARELRETRQLERALAAARRNLDATSRADAAWRPIRIALAGLHGCIAHAHQLPPMPNQARSEMSAKWASISRFLSTHLEQQ